MMTRVKETKVAGHPIETTRLGRASRRIRLQTIVWLRWLAVAGQTATILLVAFGLNFPLPLLACGLLIAALALDDYDRSTETLRQTFEVLSIKRF